MHLHLEAVAGTLVTANLFLSQSFTGIPTRPQDTLARRTHRKIMGRQAGENGLLRHKADIFCISLTQM